MGAVHVVIQHHPEYDLSSWKILGIYPTAHKDAAVKHAVMAAMNELSPKFYDPRFRFEFSDVYGYFRDNWFTFVGADNYCIETWGVTTSSPSIPLQAHESMPIDVTTIPIDSAIKDWITHHASSSEHAMKTLLEWKHGARLEELTARLAMVDDKRWINKNTKHPLGPLFQKQWEKRFFDVDLDTFCDIEKRRLCVAFKPKPVDEGDETEISLAPGVTATLRDDCHSRVLLRGIEFTDPAFSEVRLPEGVTRNEHSVHCEYRAEGDADAMIVYLTGKQGFGVDDEWTCDALPYVRLLYKRKYWKGCETSRTLEKIEIASPSENVVGRPNVGKMI